MPRNRLDVFGCGPYPVNAYGQTKMVCDNLVNLTDAFVDLPPQNGSWIYKEGQTEK
jgi:hypothetical protein